MFYVYVLKCKDGSFYAGYTDDVETRLKKHTEGKASRYTRSRLPVSLLAKWTFSTKSDAMKAEIAFKRLSRSEKRVMVRDIRNNKVLPAVLSPK